MKKYDLKFENNRNGDLLISKVNSPFFILSCGRSGSSLLSLMLNSHYRLAVPYESHLFNTPDSPSKKVKNLVDPVITG